MSNNKIQVMQTCVHQLRDLDDSTEGKSFVDPLVKEQMYKINDEIDSLSLSNNTAQVSHGIKSKKSKASKMSASGEQAMDYANNPIKIDSTMKNEDEQSSLADNIYDHLNKYSVMRRLCSNILISKDSLDLPQSKSEIVSQWSTGSTVAPETDNFTFNTVKTFELNAQPKVTQKMLDDSAIDIESWLIKELSNMFLIKEDDAFVNGDGVNQPKGILSHTGSSGSDSIRRINSSTSGTFEEDDLLNLYYSLPDYYSINASFVMNKATVHKIRTLKDSSSGQYYWMPGMLFGKADTLLGAPLYTSGNVPIADAAEKDVIIYGDFEKSYQIVDRSEITIQRDPYSAKPFVIFYATKRVGGDIIDPRGLSILKV